jgi:hypothetical protein
MSQMLRSFSADSVVAQVQCGECLYSKAKMSTKE